MNCYTLTYSLLSLYQIRKIFQSKRAWKYFQAPKKQVFQKEQSPNFTKLQHCQRTEGPAAPVIARRVVANSSQTAEVRVAAAKTVGAAPEIFLIPNPSICAAIAFARRRRVNLRNGIGLNKALQPKLTRFQSQLFS